MKKNKTIFITGAFGLIGLAISRNFLLSKYKVILADIENEKVSLIKKQLIEQGYDEMDFLLVKLDITDKNSIELALNLAIEKFGHIDALINNAAIDAKFDSNGIANINSNSFENYPIELVEKSIRVNTIGTVLITQIFCKQMLIQGFGNIINVASTYALVSPNQNLYNFGDDEETMFKPVDYIVSKSFIPNFTRYIATFYARKNIRCNAIAPHGVFNNHEKKFLDNFATLSPIGRMCDVDELFGTFKFLVSDDSAYMTGSTIVIDGGWTSW